MRVVIADDEMLLRDGLARLLEDAGFEVAGRCGDADALLRMVDARAPDVAIVDIRMPPGRADDGLSPPRRSAAATPPSACSCSRTTSTRATRRGCSRRCPSAPATCSRNASRISASRRRAVPDRRGRVRDRPDDHLAPGRAQACSSPARRADRARARGLALVAEGHSNTAIGERLFLSRKTIEANIAQIFMKLGLRESPDSTAACSRCSRSCARADGRRPRARGCRSRHRSSSGPRRVRWSPVAGSVRRRRAATTRPITPQTAIAARSAARPAAAGGLWHEAARRTR